MREGNHPTNSGKTRRAATSDRLCCVARCCLAESLLLRGRLSSPQEPTHGPKIVFMFGLAFNVRLFVGRLRFWLFDEVSLRLRSLHSPFFHPPTSTNALDLASNHAADIQQLALHSSPRFDVSPWSTCCASSPSDRRIQGASSLGHFDTAAFAISIIIASPSPILSAR